MSEEKLKSYVIPTFASDWSRYHCASEKEKRAYVRDELRRLFDAGGAVLLPILQPGVDDSPRMIALDLLLQNPSEGGKRLFDPGRVWRLKLKDGAEPPKRDAQGRTLSPEKAGKVLVCKTGNLGGERGRDEDTEESREWRGEMRALRSMTGADIYQTEEITARPAAYTLRDAILILQRWGIGVQTRQFARSNDWRPGDADAGRGQDRWLVEEVPPDAPAKGKG